MVNNFQEYFDYLKKRSLFGLWYRNLWLYPVLDRYLRGSVLDIGCGIGDFLHFRSGTIGVDINPATVAFCKDRGLDARLMEPDKLPFQDDAFEGVIMDNVLEHLSDPAPLIAEISRVLKLSGVLIIGVPGQKGFLLDPDHKIYYDEVGLTKLIQSSGFSFGDIVSMPIKSRWLDKYLTQYCVYGIFYAV